MRPARFRLTLLLLLVLACLPGPSRAQSSALDQADPTRIERRIERLKTKPPEEAPAIELPMPGMQAPRPPKEKGFILSAVSVEGATAFGPDVIAPLYQELLAQRLTLADVESIVTGITRLYQDAGFLLSRAIAPPQDLSGGVLRVRVIEGFIDQVTLQGEPPLRRFTAYTDRIEQERPLSKATLERNVLLINDLPGVSAKPAIRPIDESAGRYELVVVIERDDFDGTLYTDNRGTPAVGRLQSWTAVGANDLFDLDERLQLGYFTVPNEPDELQYVELSYDQPLGSGGTTLGASLSVSFVDASDDLAALDVESESRSFSVSLRHPLLRSRDESLWLSGHFDVRNVDQEQLGLTVVDDRLRVFRARGNYLLADDLDGVNLLQLELSQGMGAFGASESGSQRLSRLDGQSSFTKLGVTMTRHQQIGGNFGVRLAAVGQWASDPLLSSEEFALGGSQFGRAFDFAEVTGEHGAAGSIELTYSRKLGLDWLPSFQIYGFHDIGAAWNEETDGGLTRETLSSAGGGLRLQIGDWGLATLEVAKPLNRDVASKDGDDPRAFFSFSAGF